MRYIREHFAGAAGAVSNVLRQGFVAARSHELGDELIGPHFLGKPGGIHAQERSCDG